MASKNKGAISCYGSLGYLYKGTDTQMLVKNPNDFPAATFFIVITINSVLSFVAGDNTSVKY